jgi:hypothetical protein
MCNGSDGLLVSQTHHQSAIENVENGSSRLGCGIGSLIENAPHVAVAFWRAVSLGLPGAFFISRACPISANLRVTGLKSTLPAEMVPNSIAASYWMLNGRSFLRDRERLLVTA